MTPAERAPRRYRPTESKYKGGAKEMYVTYDLRQRTRGGGQAELPKVKRVYIAGEVTDWKAGGALRKRTGRKVSGVRIDYQRPRQGYDRDAYEAKRGSDTHPVKAAHVGRGEQHFSQVVEVPEAARNVHFYPSNERLPARYRHALQDIR